VSLPASRAPSSPCQRVPMCPVQGRKLLNSTSRSRGVMAKKRKKDKEEKEDYEFRPPEFDEKEFLKKEISDTRTAVLTIVYASVFGIIAGVITLLGPGFAGAAFLVGIAGMFVLKYAYPIMKVDISGFQKKNWLGNLGAYFFTFLAVWVLLLNMPFSDHASPDVEAIIVWVDDGTSVRGIEFDLDGAAWVPLNSTDKVDTMISKAANITINITARVADNGKLALVTISIGTQDSPPHAMTAERNERYGFTISSGDLSAESGLVFFITAEDEAGNSVVYHTGKTLPVAP